MTRQRFVRTASAAAALGGAAWVTKVAVLAATDGDDSLVVGLLYLLGASGITLGAAWIGVRLAGDAPLRGRDRARRARPAARVRRLRRADRPAREVGAGDAGPAWFEDEAGILAAGLVWVAVSLPAWLATREPEPATA